jgi:ABC-type sugar transport system ATPase subunit
VARAGIIDGRARHRLVSGKIEELSVRLRSVNQQTRLLSGGNQQKVVLAKWLLVEGTKLYIFDEPTRGVDVATKVDIYQRIADLAAAGAAVLLISSEMPEVLGLSDRLLIMREGRLVAELRPDQFEPERVFAHAAGLAFHAGPERRQ